MRRSRSKAQHHLSDEFCITCRHAETVDVLAGSVYCDVLRKTIGAWCVRCESYKKVRE